MAPASAVPYIEADCHRHRVLLAASRSAEDSAVHGGTDGDIDMHHIFDKPRVHVKQGIHATIDQAHPIIPHPHLAAEKSSLINFDGLEIRWTPHNFAPSLCLLLLLLNFSPFIWAVNLHAALFYLSSLCCWCSPISVLCFQL